MDKESLKNTLEMSADMSEIVVKTPQPKTSWI